MGKTKRMMTHWIQNTFRNEFYMHSALGLEVFGLILIQALNWLSHLMENSSCFGNLECTENTIHHPDLLTVI